jgi:hypothetical protein
LHRGQRGDDNLITVNLSVRPMARAPRRSCGRWRLKRFRGIGGVEKCYRGVRLGQNGVGALAGEEAPPVLALARLR